MSPCPPPAQPEIPWSLFSSPWLPMVLLDQVPRVSSCLCHSKPSGTSLQPLSTSASVMTLLEEQSLVRCNPPGQPALVFVSWWSLWLPQPGIRASSERSETIPSPSSFPLCPGKFPVVLSLWIALKTSGHTEQDDGREWNLGEKGDVPILCSP